MSAHVNKLIAIGIALTTSFASTTIIAQDAGPAPSPHPAMTASPVAQPFALNLSDTEKVERSEKFNHSKKCLELALENEGLHNQLQLCREQLLGTSGRNSCEAKTRDSDVKLDSVKSQATASDCGLDSQENERNFSSALVQAARAGNTDAQMCYFEWASPLISTAYIARYKKEAGLYMQKALQRGDWRMVQLLTTSNETLAHGGAGPIGNMSIIGSWFTIYRAIRLLQRGAAPDYKNSLAPRAKEAASHLTREQINNANVRAAQEFRLHFSSSPMLSSDPIPCLNTEAQVN